MSRTARADAVEVDAVEPDAAEAAVEPQERTPAAVLAALRAGNLRYRQGREIGRASCRERVCVGV